MKKQNGFVSTVAGKETVSRRTRICLGVADFGQSALCAAIQFYMLFYYTDVVGINAGLAGTAMLVGKLTWDMVNDILCGYWCDRTKSRWGRRRPYLIFMSIPMGLTFWLVFSLPAGLKGTAAFFAILGSFLLYDTFNTFVVLAYYSMTAEITTDYDERTRIATTRMVFNVLGYIFGAGIMTVLAAAFQSDGLDARMSWSMTGLIFGMLGALTTLFTGLTVKQKPAVNDAPSKLPASAAVKDVFRNKPFVQYLGIAMIMSVGFTLVTTMMPYFVKYQLVMESQTSLIMIIMLLTLGLCLVPCSKACDRIGKAKTYALGMGIASTALLVAFFLPQRQTLFIYAIAVLAGLGFSAQWICPHAMIPDVIEYDELLTGERREGIFYGVWSLSGKISGAFAMALSGWVLEWCGYVENVEQTQTALAGIRVLFALLPVICLGISIPMLIRYPIDRKTHAKVMEELKNRRGEN